MIKACACRNEYQDKRYGRGKRLWNHSQKKNSAVKEARCTSCGIKETV